MRDRRRGGELDAPPAVEGRPEVAEQPLAGAEQHGDDRHVELVEQSGPEVLAARWRPRRRGGRARSPAEARARSSAASMPSVTKWKVVPPAIATGSRGWWVSTKTSWWKGGSSPHQPAQSDVPQSSRTGPNMLRPMMVAPMPVLARGRGSAGRRPWPLRREDPLVQQLPADPERILLALVRARRRSRRVRGRSCAPGVRPCGDDRGRRGNSSVLPGAGRRWLRTRAVPYTGATGAADPATGVPRNLSEASRCRGEAGGPGPRPGHGQGTRGVAQLAEQRSPKPQAAGSSPVTPATARQDRPTTASPARGRHHEASEAQ